MPEWPWNSNTCLMQEMDQETHCGFIVIAGWKCFLFVAAMISTLAISNNQDDLLNELNGCS